MLDGVHTGDTNIQYFDFRLYGFCEYLKTDETGQVTGKCNRPSCGKAYFIDKFGKMTEISLCETHMALVSSMCGRYIQPDIT